MPELSQEPEQTFKSRVFLPPDPRGVKDGQGPRLRLCWGPAPRSPGPGQCLAVLASVTRGFLRRHWGLGARCSVTGAWAPAGSNLSSFASTNVSIAYEVQRAGNAAALSTFVFF